MKCPKCSAQIAFRSERHNCPGRQLSSGDPPGIELSADTGCSHKHPDGRSAIVPSKDPDFHQCELCGDDSFQAVPDEELGKHQQPKAEKEAPPKQWMILRKDLGMRKGKMVSQGGHGVTKGVYDRMVPTDDPYVFTIRLTEPELVWKKGKFTKICLGARSEEELLEIYEKAKTAGLMCSLITDAGLTEFDGVPTNTCVVIGPAYPDQVNPITGGLPLL